MGCQDLVVGPKGNTVWVFARWEVGILWADVRVSFDFCFGLVSLRMGPGAFYCESNGLFFAPMGHRSGLVCK